MTSIFEFSNYKDFVIKFVRSLPRNGRGQFRKMAEFLNVNSVVISQIFRGEKHLTPEQSVELADYFGMTASESEYFLLLVQKERASSHKLKQIIKAQLELQQTKGRELKARMPKDIEMTDEARAIFYSSWFYSGVRLLTSIKKFQEVDAVAEHLQLERSTVQKVVNFLVEQDLCVRNGGKIEMGPQRTHLGADSPLIARHHTNWRVKGFTRMDQPKATELFFTGPMALSEDAIKQIRLELVGLIRKISDIAVNSSSETTACLNLDWFLF